MNLFKQRLISRKRVSFLRSYHHIAVVGTGPSGFYTAKYCLDLNDSVRVDFFEKLPTPYGLVRSGVAPDHPEVKTVQETFTQVAENPRVRMFGNVEIVDSTAQIAHKNVLSMEELRKSYSAVVLAYGASSDVSLNIPGESMHGVVSSRSFVNWYNGHPDFVDLHKTAFDLSKVEHVVVVGQGNVALDCARILSKHPDDLRETDISTTAHQALQRSSVKTITVIGRRGHIQSAFTIKELRELTRMCGVQVLIDSAELARGRTEASMQELENNRPKKRIVDLIEAISLGSNANEESSTGGDDISSVKRTIAIKYLVTPVEIVGRGEVDGGVDRVAALKIVHNKLTGVAHSQRASPLSPSSEEDADSSNVVEELPCDLLIKSVGYKCEGLGNSIPFNPQTHTVPQVKGRVVASNLVDWPDNPVPLPGMYVTGWLKRGATGIIASNIPDAKETAAAIGEDLRAGLLKDVDDSLLTGAVDSAPEVAQRTLAHPRLHWMTTPAGEKVMSSNTVVSWADYLKIETEEARRGGLHDPAKVKEKITTIAELLKVAKGNQ